MATIGQVFRSVITEIRAFAEARHRPTLPTDVAAERLQLLLSCGF